jgi:phosphoenolpyruvate-protein kinase (PTS system EI component)
MLIMMCAKVNQSPQLIKFIQINCFEIRASKKCVGMCGKAGGMCGKAAETVRLYKFLFEMCGNV